jgi:hypothetical protein
MQRSVARRRWRHRGETHRSPASTSIIGLPPPHSGAHVREMYRSRHVTFNPAYAKKLRLPIPNRPQPWVPHICPRFLQGDVGLQTWTLSS